MTDDLAAALRDFAESERRLASTTAPDPALESSAVARRVSRRRAVRTASSAVGTLVLVGALAVGVQAARGIPEAPTGAATTPTSSPTPTRTTEAPPSPEAPSPSPSTISPAAQQPIAFSDAEPMPPGMLQAAGDGWSLMRYETRAQDEAIIAPARVYLVSPDGRPYVVPTASDPADWYLVDWAPGSPLVLASGADTGEVFVLDLLTDERGPRLDGEIWNARILHDGSTDILIAQAGTRASVRRVAADGSLRADVPAFAWQYGTESMVVSPDTTRFVVNDAAGPRALQSDGFSPLAMPAPYPERPAACRVWMWVGDTETLHECASDGSADFTLGSPSEFWLVPVGAGEARRLVGMPDAARLGGVWRMGDRLIAGTFGPSEAEAAWWEVTGSGVTLLASGGSADLMVVDVRGDGLIATERGSQEPSVPAVVRVNPITGVTHRIVEGEPGFMASFGVVPRTYYAAPQVGTGD